MTEKKTSTRFQPGRSGNPKGKPKGARNHTTRAVLELLEGGVLEVTRAVLTAARRGDLAACRLVLERIIPPSKERPVSIELPNTDSAQGCADAANAILKAVGAGDLLPGEAAILSSITENRRKSIETVELEGRIATLEGKTK